MRATPLRSASRSALAVFSIHAVMSVSAGPPFGGLYLKPPLSGGLCEGVMTMPSARCEFLARLWTRMACDTAGGGGGWAGGFFLLLLKILFVGAVGRDFLWAPPPRGQGRGMCIDANEERPVDAL